MSKLTMDKLVALCKGRGFIFGGSEIYGGLANTWDFGPLGVALKNNVKAVEFAFFFFLYKRKQIIAFLPATTCS